MAWKSISYVASYSCLSTDTKDTTDIPEGSILEEVQPDGSVKFYKFLQGDWRDL
jgi:hypothetical protein